MLNPARRLFTPGAARLRRPWKREAAVAIGVAAVLSGIAFRQARLTINTTPSEPIGLWRLTALPSYRVGDVVSACAPPTVAIVEAHARGYILSGHCPGGVAPILKPIAAVAGDVVTISAAGVQVNGRWVSHTPLARTDHEHRPLYPAFIGPQTVRAGYVFLVSDYSPRSYDSRYFGEIPVADVRYRATPVLVTHWKPKGF